MSETESNRRPIADVLRSTAHVMVRWCAKKGIQPNTISYFSIVAAMVAGLSFAFAKHQHFLLLNGVAFCFVRLYCNMLDGMVAIETKQCSKTGEVANELPDRVSDVMIFIGIAHSGLCQVLLGYWAAILSLVVAYLGTLGQAVGTKRDFSGPMSKPWRMVWLSCGVVGFWLLGDNCLFPYSFGIIDAALSAIVVGCITTFFERLYRITTALTSLEASQVGSE